MGVSSAYWKTVGLSVPGFARDDDNTKCQDAYAISCPTNDWLIAAVSDGAGSAPRAGEGAQAICKGVVSCLSEGIAKQSLDLHDVNSACARITEVIQEIRGDLENISNFDKLTDFNATLVGVLAGPAGGLFFHIGDGAGCAMRADDPSVFSISSPQNGEYANETFFFASPEWKEHLRFTLFDSRFDVIALMTDGITPFALARGAAAPYAPFFSPLSRYLRDTTEDKGRDTLCSTLKNDAIRAITDDDKTIVWAAKVKANDAL